MPKALRSTLESSPALPVVNKFTVVLFASIVLWSSAALAVPGPIPFQSFRMTGSGSCYCTPGRTPCGRFTVRGAASVIGAITVLVEQLSLDLNHPLDNGHGGFCYFGNGYGAVHGVYQGYGFGLSLIFTGMLCDVGAAGIGVPQTFNGSYLSGGQATSQGAVVWSDNGSGKILFAVRGSMRRP